LTSNDTVGTAIGLESKVIKEKVGRVDDQAQIASRDIEWDNLSKRGTETKTGRKV
jgi:hypothetical protein